jgi:hypothetical protein
MSLFRRKPKPAPEPVHQHDWKYLHAHQGTRTVLWCASSPVTQAPRRCRSCGQLDTIILDGWWELEDLNS